MILLDADSPGRNNSFESPYVHWLAINLDGGLPNNQFLTRSGTDLIDWTSPDPAKGSGWHRYLFLCFQQKSWLSVVHKENLLERFRPQRENTTARARFDIRAFLADVPGTLVGAQMFQTENQVDDKNIKDGCRFKDGTWHCGY